MMKFSELVNTRQSVRQYSNKPIDRTLIAEIVESCRLAPSASNSQPWKLIIVDEPQLKNEVAEATYSKAVSFNKFAPQAQAIAVIVIEKPRLITQVGGFLKNREFPLIDIGIIAEHFCLQAAELGIGTCMLGWFNEKKIKNLLKIPKSKRIGLVITLGYAPEEYKLREKIRKQTTEMSAFNAYE
ncbi:MAG: nitroreductase family protein [Bacteroidales bacterium]|nr:nitroreductase family protein [Bacteroidales bacterium]